MNKKNYVFWLCNFLLYLKAGTLRVREEKPPGDINGIYFDSELDMHSMNSAYLKSVNTKTLNEHNDWNVGTPSVSSMNVG